MYIRLDLPTNLSEKANILYKRLLLDIPSYSTSNENQLNSDEHSTNTAIKCKFETKLLTFHIHGLSMRTREDLETALVKVKGIVSVVIDVQHQRCIIRALPQVKPEVIAEAVYSSTLMELKLVALNANKQEVLQDVLNLVDDDNSSLPPYLPEENSPVKEKAIISLTDLRNNATNWINAATSFFQNSFYW
uniref:Armadillo repeat-containing protein 1 n=1 Tax=Clastoptera arizonana TaxID=38151 RepID=A0A1B6BWZ8_9HEMI